MRSKCIFKLVLSAIITALLVGTVYAADDINQALIDDMTRLLDQAEKNRSVNYRFLMEARELLRSYEWPWHESLLDETFRDGDYTHNPAWVVDAGQFQVIRGVGLRSQETIQTTPESAVDENRSRDAVSRILDILLQGTDEQPVQQETTARSEAASIHIKMAISNSFLIEVDVSSLAGNGDSGFSFGPYQGDRRDTGYLLVYRGGTKPAIELHRYTYGRNAIVEIRENVPLFDDRLHTLTWQRRNDGEMTVLLDGSKLFTTSDRGLRDPFSGFTLMIEAGQFAFSRVRIHGEKR
ncbi:MAG: hypothetical protein WD750_00490 [Gammaproteobacteria bacterium]